MSTPRRSPGPPITFDAHQRQKYLDAVTAGAKLQDAALTAGIAVQWVNRLAQTDPVFGTAFNTARTAGKKARLDKLPHGETRYIKAACRCPICTKEATANRTARRNRPQPDTDDNTSPDQRTILQLPTRPAQHGNPAPLAAAS